MKGNLKLDVEEINGVHFLAKRVDLDATRGIFKVKRLPLLLAMFHELLSVFTLPFHDT